MYAYLKNRNISKNCPPTEKPEQTKTRKRYSIGHNYKYIKGIFKTTLIFIVKKIEF